VMQPESVKAEEFYNIIKGIAPDLLVVVAFGHVLPKRILAIPALGAINIHASLLPKYRGPAPIQRAIEAGETETGITVFKIDEGVDTGGVLLQQRVEIGSAETTPELYERLSRMGAEALATALEGISSGSMVPVPQSGAGTTRAPKLVKEEAVIDWKLSANSVFNKIRAFKPFPGTCTFLDEKRLGITQAEPVELNLHAEPGTVAGVTNSFFDVACGRGALRVLEVKPEGRNTMSVHDYLLGTSIREGTHFGGRT